MLTRSGLDWTHRIPAVAQAVSKLAPANITLDGEVVVLAENGTTNFADLQASFQEGAKNPLTYFCFDLLHVEGKNVRDLTLVARKKLLADLLSSGDGDTIRFSEHIGSGGEAVFQKACELHAEGIVSKKAAGRYIDGRSGDWLKSKCLHEQEFVIGGYSLPSDGSHGVGSLLLGYYRSGKLIYAGRTGTGFTQKMRRSLREKLEPLETNAVSFDHPPSEAKRGAIWVKPQLIAQVRFATWTSSARQHFSGFAKTKLRRTCDGRRPQRRQSLRAQRQRNRLRRPLVQSQLRLIVLVLPLSLQRRWRSRLLLRKLDPRRRYLRPRRSLPSLR